MRNSRQAQTLVRSPARLAVHQQFGVGWHRGDQNLTHARGKLDVENHLLVRRQADLSGCRFVPGQHELDLVIHARGEG